MFQFWNITLFGFESYFFLPGTNLSLKVQARMEDKVRIKNLKSLFAFFEKFGRVVLFNFQITLPHRIFAHASETEKGRKKEEEKGGGGNVQFNALVHFAPSNIYNFHPDLNSQNSRHILNFKCSLKYNSVCQKQKTWKVSFLKMKLHCFQLSIQIPKITFHARVVLGS